jgi:hypothetical protein
METLHQFRLRCLPQEMPDKRYLEMLDETPSPWLDAMKHCYDTLTASPYLFGSVTQRTELIALPLPPDGQFNRHHEVKMSSGYDARAPVSNGEETGWCAERKLLENNFPGLLEPLFGKHDIWLFYLTRSPCFYCSNAIVATLAQKSLKHIVVAFESFYGSLGDPLSAPSDAFLHHVKTNYNPRNPGIELFKVYRSREDNDALRQAEEQALPIEEALSERCVYRMILEAGDQGTLVRVPSRRRKDTAVGPLGRDTRTVNDIRTALGNLAVISGEVKDPLVCDDPTLRFRRIIRRRH